MDLRVKRLLEPAEIVVPRVSDSHDCFGETAGSKPASVSAAAFVVVVQAAEVVADLRVSDSYEPGFLGTVALNLVFSEITFAIASGAVFDGS